MARSWPTGGSPPAATSRWWSAPGQGEQIAELIRPSLRSADVFTVSGGTLDAADDLGGKLRARSYDAVVGIGGGKTIDVAKYAATRRGLPMVSVATSLANDGIASPVASLITDGIKGSYGVHIPIAVIVDLDFVESGPDRHNRAGIGDVISNISALADWELSRQVRDEPVDGLAASLLAGGRRSGAQPPGRHERRRLRDRPRRGVDLQRPGDGGRAAPAVRAAAAATRSCTRSTRSSRGPPRTASWPGWARCSAPGCAEISRRFGEMSACLARHGLPRLPAEVALTDDQFVEAVQFAPRTRPDRYTILEHLALSPTETRERLADYAGAIRDQLG